jgi:hypothetical protein
MFNSPLHPCKICSQYVALDQSSEECARTQDCKIERCPYAELFRAPAPAEDAKPAAPEKPLGA